MTKTPEEIIDAIAASAVRHLSPCGKGQMVSHIWGDGQPLVLLHGHSGSWTHWIRNIEQLRQHYRVIAFDIPGFGESALPPEPYDFRSIAEIIAAGIREITGHEKLSLAGFSYGAALAAETAHQLGSRLRNLVLISPGSNMADITMAPIGKFANWRTLATREERDAAHRRNLEIIMIADPVRIDPMAIAAQRINAEQARLKVTMVEGAGTIQRHVPSLQVPVSFIWGERDSRIGPNMAQRTDWIRRYRPSARYSIIPDAGHWVTYEQPERCNIALLDLLTLPA